MRSKKSFLNSIYTAIIIFVMMVPHFYNFIFHPNKYSTSLGGDGLITYYQMIFHAKYGDGTHLSSMNYPDGEFLFLTDGNGVFALIFKYFSTYIYDITDIIPGVYTSIVLLGFIVAAVLMYFLLKSFHVHSIIAVIAAPIIILLSPQILRFIPHYSQAFPFIIPLALLWFVRKTRVLAFEKRDILIWLVFFLMFLNNSYMGAISLGIALVSTIFYILIIKDKRVSISLVKTMITPIISIVLTTFLILKLNDPYADRLKTQWGFFAYNAELSGFFYPDHSFLNYILNYFKEMKPRGIEMSINLGLIPIITITFYFISKVIKKAKINLAFGPHNKAILYGALLMFLFASNSNYMPFLQDIGEKYFGPLLMFKATARFAWPLYFLATIVTCQILTAYLDRWVIKGKKWGYIVIVAILSLWYLESNWLLNQNYMETSYKNPFQSDIYQDLEKIATDHDINLDNYQAMYMIPLVQAWHDNLITENNFWSEYTGVLLSSMTGIPMINAKLSRNSTSITYRSTQMVSSPLIKRGILDSLPNNKPILLIEGKVDYPLKEGEEYLKSISTLIHENTRGKYKIYSLSIDSLKANKTYQEALAKIKNNTISKPNSNYIEDHFNENLPSIYGDKAHEIKPDSELPFKEITIDIPTQSWYHFSIWSLEKGIEYGTIEWHIEVTNNDYTQNYTVVARECRDIYGSWIRSNLTFPLPEGKNQITIKYYTRIPIVVDEFLLRNVNDTILFKDPEDPRYLYNGYIMDMEDLNR